MFQVNSVKQVHIELTDKCQAQCPMCARNYHGGATRPFIRNGDISIDQFKEWFPKNFLQQLTNFYSCGNYGDPAFAQDCLEIFSYVRSINSHTRLAIHTNGGMRSTEWWKELAQYNIEVIFAVDGFKGKHELYRKNTKFDKVIENLKSFIDAGGNARVDSLVFAHNENDVDELEKYLKGLGVQNVQFISTNRFYEMDTFEVHNNTGDVEYLLERAVTERFYNKPNSTLTSLLDEDVLSTSLENATIKPRCVEEQSIYIDPYGNILPCCYIGSDYLEQPIKETLPIHILRNKSMYQTQEIMKKLGVPNCKDKVLHSNNFIYNGIEEYWSSKNKCMTCAKACSNMLYDKRR